MEPTEQLDDKAYCMACLHQAMRHGLINDALSLIAENDAGEAATDWAKIRLLMDQLLRKIDASQKREAYEVRYEEN